MGLSVGGDFNSRDFNYSEGDQTITNDVDLTHDMLRTELKEHYDQTKKMINDNKKSDEEKMNSIIKLINKKSIVDKIVELGIERIKKYFE